MKNFLILVVLFFSLQQINAQISLDEVQLMQLAVGKDKKKIIEQKIKLNDREADKFWAVYHEYEDLRKSYSQKRLELIEKYANEVKSLTPEQAKELVNETLKNHEVFNDLLTSTYKKMSKAVGEIKAAEFIQIESYMESLLRVEIFEAIPFINEVLK
jgi:hypothetical protein